MIGVHYVRTFSRSEEKKHIRYICAGVLLLFAAYTFISLALDSGSYWEYLIGLVTFGFGIKYLISGVRHTRSKRK